jgi:hypothetical protein
LGAEMTIAAPARAAVLGLTRSETHGYVWADGSTAIGPLPSVTTIIGVLDKSGPLIGWAKRVTAEAAIDNREQIPGWVELGGRDGAVSLLTKAASVKRDRAADVGSRVHALAEAVARGQEITLTEEERPFLTAYQHFLEEWKPRYLAAEEMVISLQHGYGGTFDAIVEMIDDVWMLDTKTSKGVYPETALQLAAYANADFIGRPADPKRYRIPAITAYGVLHLRPENGGTYEVVPYTVTDGTFQAFLAARALLSWRETEGQMVMGQPLGRAIVTRR